MSDDFGAVVNTAIWQEEPELDNPFAAALCRCHGYDVFGEVLLKASYIDYLYLMFRGERPTPAAAQALTVLAIALANPGPRDPSVHAAMATGATGTPAASTLMSAIAAGAGTSGGARELWAAMRNLEDCASDLPSWRTRLAAPLPNRPSFWPEAGHAPGFDPHGQRGAAPVAQLLAALQSVLPAPGLDWLLGARAELESAAGLPMNLLGAAAAGLHALGFDADTGEMLALLLRLPGAAAHALEQRQRGFRQFPFFDLALESDPGPATAKVST